MCRDIHKKDVRLAKGASTTLSVPTMRDMVECEKCGLAFPVGEMMKHRLDCMQIKFADLPGLAPEGELAEK